MLAILKRAFSAIAAHWKVLTSILVALLLAVPLALVLRKFPPLRIPVAAVGVCVSLIVLLWQFPKWQVRSIVGLDSKDRFDLENEARKTLSQIVGGLVLLVGFYFTWENLKATQHNLELAKQSQAEAQKATQENLRIASEGQLTDRFTKAIAQLGDTKLEIRLGGIYSLERIAKDSPTDHWSIMEVLTAYVREHARVNPSTKPFLPLITPKFDASTKPLSVAPSLKNQSKNGEQSPKPAPDIQAILTVIGRRTLTYQHGEGQPLDLHETDLRGSALDNANLRGADLYNVDLRDVQFRNTDLSGANLRFASVNGADLSRSRFNHADLSRADLSETSLNEADLSGADLRLANLFLADFTGTVFGGADLRHAYLGGTDLVDADLRGMNLSEVYGLSSPIQLENTKGDASTKLPPGIPRPKSWQ